MACFARIPYEELLAQLELRGAKRLPLVQELLSGKLDGARSRESVEPARKLDDSQERELERLALTIRARQVRDGKGRTLRQIVHHVKCWLNAQRRGINQQVYCGSKALELTGETLGVSTLRGYMADLVSYGLLNSARTTLDDARAEKLISLVEGDGGDVAAM
jgi:DNA-binding PucR family transcriptional regulator